MVYLSTVIRGAKMDERMYYEVSGYIFVMCQVEKHQFSTPQINILII